MRTSSSEDGKRHKMKNKLEKWATYQGRQHCSICLQIKMIPSDGQCHILVNCTDPFLFFIWTTGAVFSTTGICSCNSNITGFINAVVLLGFYPKELKTYVHVNTCIQVFIAASLIIANTLNQPRCPAAGEWMKKFWYIQTMKYYSILKRNELASHEKTWKNLKCIVLSEWSQLERLHTIWFYFCSLSDWLHSMWFYLRGILEKAKLWRQ